LPAAGSPPPPVPSAANAEEATVASNKTITDIRICTALIPKTPIVFSEHVKDFEAFRRLIISRIPFSHQGTSLTSRVVRVLFLMIIYRGK
jgi:hypothetical protein